MRITPNIFLTSDTHFGHSKMWETWKHRKEGFEEELIKAWNNVVGKDDVVLHLGDLSLANKEKTQGWTLKLNGKKYLIRGNHDGNSDAWYVDCGFEVIPSAYQRFGLKDGRYMHILFTHEPVTPTPFLSLLEGWYNIHGHLHGDNHRDIPITDFHYDVGVDAVGFEPVPLYSIIASLKRGKEVVEPSIDTCGWCGKSLAAHSDEKPIKAVPRVPCLMWKGGFWKKYGNGQR